MVNPPRQRVMEFTQNNEHVRMFVDRTKGRRRNFAEDMYKRPHRYAVGAKVYMCTGITRAPYGPLYVKEHCPAMLPGGFPQYILQQELNGDNTRWIHTCEANIYQFDDHGDRIW